MVVETGSTFSIGTVAGFISGSKNARAWIVQKIDLEGHKDRMLTRDLAKFQQELRELLE